MWIQFRCIYRYNINRAKIYIYHIYIIIYTNRYSEFTLMRLSSDMKIALA